MSLKWNLSKGPDGTAVLTKVHNDTTSIKYLVTASVVILTLFIYHYYTDTIKTSKTTSSYINKYNEYNSTINELNHLLNSERLKISSLEKQLADAKQPQQPRNWISNTVRTPSYF